MVTINDIAAEVGVSRGTVDRVLNHRGRTSAATEKKIEEAAKRLGYQKGLAGAGLAARKKKLQFGFVYIDVKEASFHHIIYAAAKDKAEELSQYGVTVHFFAIRIGESEMIRFREFVCSHPQISGWAVPGEYAREIRNIEKEQNRSAVPIVTYNVDCNTSEDRICYVGCDYRKAGRMACGLTALMSGTDARVLVISDDPGGVRSEEERLQGFREEMLHYPNIEIVRELYMEEREGLDAPMLKKRVRETLSAHPEITTVYLINPGDYSICNVVSEASGDNKKVVITNDLVTDEQVAMIRDGRITATIDQEPELQGSRPLEILFDYLAMDRKPVNDWEKRKLSIIIRQNLDEDFHPLGEKYHLAN
ncbi:MAG: LacI family DNA-binding transcriptional regulator [Lachnospiraceae bacterium]|nr:LacI family DNA-binding transcriptional regulator [Lachnospiraceae bacterium]